MTIDLNYQNLHSLEVDLQEKEGVYLKVEGSGETGRVVVVQGRFWNWIAALASWFGVRSYDLNEITKVFQRELSQSKTLYKSAKDISQLKEVYRTSRYLTHFFITEMQPSHKRRTNVIANEGMKESDRVNVLSTLKHFQSECAAMYEQQRHSFAQKNRY